MSKIKELQTYEEVVHEFDCFLHTNKNYFDHCEPKYAIKYIILEWNSLINSFLNHKVIKIMMDSKLGYHEEDLDFVKSKNFGTNVKIFPKK